MQQRSYRFEGIYSENELARTLEEQVQRARASGLGCAAVLIFGLTIGIVKVAIVGSAAFVLLPLLLAPLSLQNYFGVRFWRVRSGGQFVLWLRRFHRQDLRRFPSASVLQQACMRVATPVTIQDSVYRHSYTSLVARGLIPVIGACFLSLLAGCFITLIICGCLVQAAEAIQISDTTSGILILILAIPSAFLAMRWTVQRSCYTRLSLRTATTKVEKMIRRIKAGKATFALQVWRCGDDFWQQTVERSIQRADAVVIDVTELGENILWELRQVARHVPGERLVLCCASSNGHTVPDELTLVRELLETFGSDYFALTRRVVYELPLPLPKVMDWFARKVRDCSIVTVFIHKQAYVSFQVAIWHALNGSKPEIPPIPWIVGPPPLPITIRNLQ